MLKIQEQQEQLPQQHLALLVYLSHSIPIMAASSTKISKTFIEHTVCSCLGLSLSIIGDLSSWMQEVSSGTLAILSVTYTPYRYLLSQLTF